MSCTGSVEKEACNRRHLGQSPSGASAGISPPHFGQLFCSDGVPIPVPEAYAAKGYSIFTNLEEGRLFLGYKRLANTRSRNDAAKQVPPRPLPMEIKTPYNANLEVIPLSG